ncbi:hypothetical protein M9H77_13167 [Catharanthus roseus]|uniref:Uncharacterized protein n=1 Tax=Catharanthus roseus TaxID=4058 RepID=A0ACC0BJM6_CATRO|nr:hypothetical protein M9H77_13167 [Catharanthus roseus]
MIMPNKGCARLKREDEAILEQSSRRNLGGHFMHNNQWGYGNFSPHARSYEHNSYDCYEGNRLGARNYYNDRSYERVLRNEVRNGRNYVKIDERFHKRKGNVEKYMIVMIIISIAMIKKNRIKTNQESLMKQALRIRHGVENHEGKRQGQAKVKFIERSIIEEAPKVKELPHATIEAKEIVEIHVEKETSNEDFGDNMNEKSIEKKECNEFKEKERVEKKERLCIFDFISIFSKESEHLECSK